MSQISLPFKPDDLILEVGCGDSPIRHDARWHTMDYRKLPCVDVVGNLEEVWPVADATYDGVIGKFCIEHVSWRKVNFFAEQCFRVLKPGGMTFLVGPNTLAQCKEIARLNRIGIEESALLYGGQEEPLWNEHKAAFSPEYAVEIYKKAGFERVDIQEWPGQIWTGARTDMVIIAYKTESHMNIAKTAPNEIPKNESSQNSLIQQPWFKEMEQTMVEIPKTTGIPQRKLALNIGSFTVCIRSNQNTQWVNTDILDMSQWAGQNGFDFKQFDARKGIPWPDSSMDFMIAYHFLEHITRQEGETFLKECHRVLKPGGVVRIGVPDTKVIIRFYLEGKIHDFDANEGVKKARDFAEAFWNLLTAGHVTDYDEDSLGNKLILAGFATYQCEPNESKIPEIIADTKDMYAGTDMLKLPPHTLFVEGIKPYVGKPTIDRLVWVRDRIKGATSVVDIGCFDAPITRGLDNCTWVDVLSYEQITDLSKKAPPFSRDKFVQATAQRLPFTDKQFSVAILSEILEHVALPIIVLKEAARVAERVLITVPNEYDWDIKHDPFTNPGNARTYNEQLLRQHLEEAGYKDYQLERLDYQGWSYFTVDASTAPAKTQTAAPPILEKTFHRVVGELTAEKRSLKIGLISTQFFGVPPKGYSGLEMIVWDMACGLSELGHDVTLFAPEGSKPPQNGRVIFTGPALQTTNIDWLGAERGAYEIYKTQLDRLDIIHGHNWFGFEYAAKAANTKLRCCHTHHGHLNPEWWLKNRPPFKLNFVGISKHMQAEYRQQGMESRYVYNGIDLKKYIFEKKRGSRLLFVGRLSPIKQPHIAIEIAKKLGMGLDIVGGTFVAPQEVDYMNQVKSLCDGKEIVLYADASHEKKVELMQNARCLIFPSNMGEPFGLVAAEAMACGSPVISTADGAIGEVVQDGVTGFVCKTQDEMIAAIGKIDNIVPEDCWRRVKQNFSRETMARAYEKLYREILEGREW